MILSVAVFLVTVALSYWAVWSIQRLNRPERALGVLQRDTKARNAYLDTRDQSAVARYMRGDIEAWEMDEELDYELGLKARPMSEKEVLIAAHRLKRASSSYTIVKKNGSTFHAYEDGRTVKV